MSIDYQNEIKPLEDQGISDENISVHLNSKTLFSMQSEECKYILQDNAAVLLDPVKVDQRSGSLIDYYQSLEAGDAKSLIAFYLGRVYADQPVATDQYPRSIQFASVEASLPESLKEVSAKLVESAGGRPHSGVTAADVAASRAAWQQAEADRIAEEEAKAEAERIAREEKKAEEERQRRIDEQLQANDAQFWSLYNQHVAVLKDNREVNGWQAAIQAMADGWVE
jgi:K+-transporting ATPase c subunit